MSQPTLVVGGPKAFHLPRYMIETPLDTALRGPSYRVLYWLMWRMHANNRWPNQEDDPCDIAIRVCAAEMLRGAGVAGHKDYGVLRTSLQQLQGTGYLNHFPDGSVRVGVPLFLDVEERPGPHFDIVFSATFARVNGRPLNRYGLLNLDHVVGLHQPLDFEVYARACQVARARHPVFDMDLDELALRAGTTLTPSWSTLRKAVLGAHARVARATGCRFIMQASWSGNLNGVDHLRVHVGMPDRKPKWPFAWRHRARYFQIDAQGHRTITTEAIKRARASRG
jgi:hypothetical protein